VQYYCNSRLFTARAVNISEGGLRLEGTGSVRVGDELKLFVPLSHSPRGKMCLLVGQVVWSDGARAGVSFVDPPLETILDVRGFVRMAA